MQLWVKVQFWGCGGLICCQNCEFVSRNWPIGKPLPSNIDEPIAVEYQLHWDQNSDIFRFQRHRETLEDPKRK